MTLSKLLKESTQKNHSSTALIFQGRKWSYQELYESVHKVASSLQELGIGKGDRVALLLKNSPEFVITTFALSQIGAIAVPMNFLQNPDELEYIYRDATVSAIVVQPPFLKSVQSFFSKVQSMKFLLVAEVNDHSTVPNNSVPQELLKDPKIILFSSLLTKTFSEVEPHCQEDEPIIILYTSGTTGKPKGVILSHQNLTGNALGAVEAFGLTPKERFIALLPMFHIFCWTCNVLVPIYLGSPIIIIESIRPPKPWLKLMFKHKVTVFEAVPQIYSILAEQAKGIKGWVLKHLFFGHVNFCISGAAPLSVEIHKTFQGKFGKFIYEGYGLTETSPLTSVNTPSAKKVGSVGRPIKGVQVKIIDSQEKELSIGEEGEICIRGTNVMRGYYNQPQATKETFTQDGWLKTGDVGLLDEEGFLFIRDRIKDMIIVKGLKVFSIQVENVLLSHSAVAEAAVVGIPSPDGDEIIKGFVVLKEGQSVEKLDLLKFCQERLAAYKRPRDIEIRKELPKNALQKVLKRELRK